MQKRRPVSHDLAAPLPDGVTTPHDWGDRPIPTAGADAPRAVDTAVTEAMRRHGIVGCGVCVLRAGRVLFARGYGYADREKERPFLPTTATRCGSLAKPVTALCALLLCDAGKLRLDEPILPLLKEVGIMPKPTGRRRGADERVARITVRHLMDHTSGLPRGATYTAWRPNRDVGAAHRLNRVATAADVAADALGNFDLEDEPGASFRYANANYVLLARVVEARGGMPFGDFLARVLAPRFDVPANEVFVSRNQDAPDSPARGANEAAYYQTSAERYVSYRPEERARGQMWGEAYRGYATEASDGAGGIACSALALGKLLANLSGVRPTLAAASLHEIATAPDAWRKRPDFDPRETRFYSKGFYVYNHRGEARPLLAHGGMTNHCGGVIGYNAGYRFVAVSNGNTPAGPYVDALLDRALAESVKEMG